MRTLKNAITLFLFLSLISVSASAQKGTATNKSQAVLTIQANVVPVIAVPNQSANAQDQLVSYSIPVAAVRYTMTQTIRHDAVEGRSVRILVKTVVEE